MAFSLPDRMGPFNERLMNVFGYLMAAGVVVSSVLAEPAELITLESVAGRVRADHPELVAARYAIAEAAGLAKQAGRLANPQLGVEFEHNSGFREGRVEVGLSQRFPVTRRLGLEKARGATLIEAARAEVREVENQLVGEARAALVRVITLRQRAELVGRQADLSGELADFIRSAAERGEASPLEAGQARLEAARFVTERRQLAAAEREALGRLKPLLGMRVEDVLLVSGRLPDLKPGGGGPPLRRPALEAARLAVRAAEQEAEVQRANRLGDVNAGAFVAGERIEDAPDGRRDDGIVGIRFSVPLPWWDRNEGNIEAAEARVRRRRQEVLALDRKIRVEAEAARAEMIEWAGLIDEIDAELMPQADEQAALVEQAWRNGQADLLTVLRAREQRLELAAARLDALQNFHLAEVRYGTVLGNF